MRKTMLFAPLLFAVPLVLAGCGGGSAQAPPPATSAVKQWTWMSGSNDTAQWGVYGTQGTAAASNIPGARDSAVSWSDASGNLWLFGGTGYPSAGTSGLLNDLWKYSGGQWTWMSGSNIINQKGVYGTQGTAAAGNIPGGRLAAVSWSDASGNLWLFGGTGFDSAPGLLNDLWKYSGGQWTWMSGSNIANQNGVYGTQGTAAASNVPGARNLGATWSDASGNLWLFGGAGYPSAGTSGFLNDLWKYSGGQWTWMGGSNIVNQNGVYGTQGVIAPSNIPGSRQSRVSWTDDHGNLWLFGGYGFSSTGPPDLLNDLWMYMP